MQSSRFTFLPVVIVVLLVTMSCSLFTGLQPEDAPAAPAQEQPESPAQAPPAAQPPEAAAPEAEAPSPYPAPQTSEDGSAGPEGCAEVVCIQDGSFVLERPIGPDGRLAIDHTSRYGTTNKSTREMYHGVQFLNSTGTPVLAAAAGKVVVAGDDSQVSYGPYAGAYGNLVVIEHEFAGVNGPVYTLYAHLSEFSVEVNQSVGVGEEIGKVGMTGSVSGSTLYFEVRVGENTYDAASNPELWLKLLPDATGAPSGSLAGRVLDGEGNYISVSNIQVEAVQKSVQQQLKQLFLRTYGEKNARGVQPWGESFAASGLPEGSYQISFWVDSQLYQRVVEVQPGMLTFVTFKLK